MAESLKENGIFRNAGDVFLVLGGFGRFQQLLTACFCLVDLPSALSILIMYFAALNPSWKCSSNSSMCLGNGTFPSDNKDRCAMQRSDWEFTEPRDFSIVTQFDVYCDKEWVIYLTTSILFIGWMVGAVVLGWVSDNYGRKFVLFPSYLIIMLVGFIAAFSPSLTFLVICRFIIGFCIPGASIQAIVLLSEYVTTKYRPHLMTVLSICFSATLCLLSLKAYYIREWKVLFIVCTLPYMFIMAFYKFVPESVRWLHLHEKIDDMMKIFHRMGYWNKKTIPANFTILSLNGVHKSNPVDLFRTRKMAVNTLVQGYSWLVNGMVYYGLSLAADDLGGSLYTNVVLLTIIEFPADILTLYMCNIIGRKRTTAISMAFGGIACVLIAFIPSTGNIKIFRIALGMLGKFCITISFCAVYVWSLEIYSTNIRAEGIGFLQITSRVGAASSPWIAKGLKALHGAAPFIVMGTLALIASIVCLILPETNGKPIKDTIEDDDEEEALEKDIVDCKLSNNSLIASNYNTRGTENQHKT